MEHVFKGFGFSEAYGLEGVGEVASADASTHNVSMPDYSTTVPVKLNIWTTPNESRLLISVAFRCPRCSFPLYVPATQAGVAVDDGDASASSLSIRQAVGCPAHWEQQNDYGQTEGRTVKCGWSGVVRDNVFHHPRCSSSNFAGNSTMCSCTNLYGRT
jgi:hypothetical protein